MKGEEGGYGYVPEWRGSHLPPGGDDGSTEDRRLGGGSVRLYLFGLDAAVLLCAVCAVHMVSLGVWRSDRGPSAPVMHGRLRQMGLEHGRNLGHVTASTAEYDVLDLVRANPSISQYSIGLR